MFDSDSDTNEDVMQQLVTNQGGGFNQTVIDKYLNLKENVVKDTLGKSDSLVNVTCDLWSTFSGEDRYLYIVCHYVRDDWAFRNFVIGFEILSSFDFDHIAKKILDVLGEFGLKKKVGSISFEDSVSKDKCMEHLCKEFNPVVLEMFAIDRSYANVVDLCGQLIVDELCLFVDPVRELLRWFRCKRDKNEMFGTLCKKMRLKLRTFCFDFSKGWRNTIMILETVYEYRNVFTKLYDDDCGSRCRLEDSQWDAIKVMIDLVSKFVQVSERFLSAYSVVCHLVIQDCVAIVHTLKVFESDPRFGSVVRSIRSKWLELFPDIPTVYCVAMILDPSVKVEGLRHLLAYYYETVGVNYDVDEKVAHCMNVVQQLFDHYALSQEPETDMTASLEDQNKSSSSLEFNVVRDVLKRKRGDVDQQKSDDLANYLFYEFEVPEKFDILEWWEAKREILSVLGKVAKDVLCTPLSTIFPNQRLCPGKRVLDKQRSLLPPGLLRVCICKTDWDLALESCQEGMDDYDRMPFDTDFEEIN